MTGRRMQAAVTAAVTLALAGLLAGPSAAAPELIEVPYFRADLAAGNLPPIARRVPAEPAMAKFSGTARPGRYGGRLQMLMGRPRDTKLMVVYGYARLVGYDLSYRLVPDILKSFEVKDGRVFTLRLRRGHRWSDGAPFTAEDFRYYWEHVATHPKLSPGGLPAFLLVNGKPPRFEVLDRYTVRYTWSLPNPEFLPALAAASPRFIYRPAHYLKRFHADFAKPSELEAEAEALRLRDWTALHGLKDNMYRFDNPDLPTLQPWVNRTYGPAQRYQFTRNPYFHRVDAAGRQLPYIDEVVMRIVGSSLIPAKTAGGESDLQARYLQFSDYTFLKAAEARADYRVHLWRTARGAHLALYPNLNVRDPVWRNLFWKANFRRALSLAVNRHEINQVLYYGLGVEGNNSVLPESPLYRPEFRFKWAVYDPARANRMLDELGLSKRDDDGIRLLPDGRPMEIIVETSGEHTEQSDVLELVRDSWRKIGIKLFTKPSQREVFRRRIMSGEAQMSISSGLTNGLATADMSPRELAPDNPYQLQWPAWGRRAQTQASRDFPLKPVRRLAELARRWRLTGDEETRRRIWQEMLEIHAEQVYCIGLIGGVLRPVVVRNGLNNVPAKGIYHWDPGAYFGIYRMDGFWFGRRGQGG